MLTLLKLQRLIFHVRVEQWQCAFRAWDGLEGRVICACARPADGRQRDSMLSSRRVRLPVTPAGRFDSSFSKVFYQHAFVTTNTYADT